MSEHRIVTSIDHGSTISEERLRAILAKHQEEMIRKVATLKAGSTVNLPLPPLWWGSAERVNNTTLPPGYAEALEGERIMAVTRSLVEGS